MKLLKHLNIKNSLKIKNLKLKIFLLVACYMLLVTPAHAQVKIGQDVFKTPITDFGSLVSVIVSNLYIIAGIVVLFLLVFAGIGIISGAGSGDKQKTSQGKQSFTWAIVGFLIIFASYWIIQIVEVITGLKIL